MFKEIKKIKPNKLKLYLITFLFALCFFIIAEHLTVIADDSGINVIINGNKVAFTDSTGYPYVDSNNRTMVPLRITMESAGACVGYDSNKNTAIVITEHDRIEVPIGTDYLYNNNVKIQNDTEAVVNNGRTYLPIRAVLESADYMVEWDKSTQTVNVYNFAIYEATLVPYSTSNLQNLAEQLLNGNVVYINGQYYATPSYVKSLANTQVTYYGNDLNTAIYPQANRYINIDEIKESENSWVSGLNNFELIMVIKDRLDTEFKYYEEYVIPEFIFVYGFRTTDANGIENIYYLTEITEEFLNADNAEGTFNGIRMRKENGELYFNSKDLVNLGLY